MKPEASKTSVRISIGSAAMHGDLGMPADPHGLVVFAHGSGSSRHSPRNQYVARVLESRNLATLLIDLLTPEEEAIDNRTAALRFDIPMLAGRLVAIVDWLRHQPETAALPIGLFGASTGGGAALIAAAERPREVAAVVSRGGRPDLAGPALARVTTPHAADRRRARHAGDPDEPGCDETDGDRGHTRNRARGDPSVRGARDPRRGCGACRRLVYSPSPAGARGPARSPRRRVKDERRR